MMMNVTMLHILENYCKEAKIKIIWSSWGEEDSEFYANSNFNNFAPYITQSPGVSDKNLQNLPFWEIAADNSHFGTYWTSKIAQQYFEIAVKFYEE